MKMCKIVKNNQKEYLLKKKLVA